MENPKQLQAEKAAENKIESERGPEKTSKEIVDEIFRVHDHIYLIDADTYQSNIMMSLKKEYEKHSSFIGQTIPQTLYNEALEVGSRNATWQEQIDRKIFDVDALLEKTGEDQWGAEVFAEIIHRDLITKDELTSLLKKRKEVTLIPENQKTYNEWKIFAKQVHNDYLNFLESRLAVAKIEDLEQTERGILAKLRRAEVDGKIQSYIDKDAKMLEFVRKYLSKFGERKAFNQERDKRISLVIEKIKDKYHISEKPLTLYPQLETTDSAFGGLDKLEGKKILDLASGSVIDENSLQLMDRAASGDSSARQEIIKRGMYDLYTHREEDPLNPLGYRLYEPWFSRALLELGAKPVGIDVGNLDGEEFEHHRVDLSQPGALDFLPDKSFDAVNLNGLFSSPQLESMTGESEVDKMKEELKKQIRRILKADGQILEYSKV